MSDSLKYLTEAVAGYLAICSIFSGKTNFKPTLSTALQTFFKNGTISTKDESINVSDSMADYINIEIQRDQLVKDLEIKLSTPAVLSMLGFAVTAFSLQQEKAEIPSDAFWIAIFNIGMLFLILTLSSKAKQLPSSTIRFAIMLPVFVITIGLNIYFKSLI